MKQIFHPHSEWEEVRHGLYSLNTEEEAVLIDRVKYFFYQFTLVDETMGFVVDNFTKSCEQVFTNPNMNHIAWLGQVSVAVWSGISYDLTRKAWHYIPEYIRIRSDKLAEKHIKRWKDAKEIQ